MNHRRKSTTKSSMFKLQAEKKVFEEYIENIAQCKMLRLFPQINKNQILESSEKVFNYCFNFTEDSPFTLGLNYGCKQLGFSSHQGIVKYRQYLPGVFKAYILGDFNQFNQNSHQMIPVQDSDSFFEIDLNSVDIDEGTVLILRIIDLKGNQFKMTPPSCFVTKGQNGIYIRYRKSPFCCNQTLLTDILSYSLDLDIMLIDKAIKLLQQNKDILKGFNVIVIKNWWKKESVLANRFKIQQQVFDTFLEIINYIHQEIGIKVVLELNCQNLHHKNGNSVEEQYTKQSNGTKNWDFNNPKVFQFYLSILAYYITYFNIDGFHFNNIHNFIQISEGITLLKCISIMKKRMFDHGILTAQSTSAIPGLCYPLLEGGIGIDFAIQNLQPINLTTALPKSIVEDIEKWLHFFNCLKIKVSNSEVQLNLLLSYICSPNGVFYEGQLSNNKQSLSKILHLRKQSVLFQQPFVLSETGSQIIKGVRGDIYIYFNFSEVPIEVTTPELSNFELLFNSLTEEPKINGQILTIHPKCCLIYQIKENEQFDSIKMQMVYKQ